jgi:hypothetical protein
VDLKVEETAGPASASATASTASSVRVAITTNPPAV